MDEQDTEPDFQSAEASALSKAALNLAEAVERRDRMRQRIRDHALTLDVMRDQATSIEACVAEARKALVKALEDVVV